MQVEALYRDGSTKRLIAHETSTLKDVVEQARRLNDSGIKFIKVVDRDRDNRRVDL